MKSNENSFLGPINVQISSLSGSQTYCISKFLLWPWSGLGPGLEGPGLGLEG